MAENGAENFEARLEALERRVAAIEERNRNVEREKAWETSFTRRAAILVLTYFVMCLVFEGLGSGTVFTSALIPTLGFFLSSLSLPIVRTRWRRRSFERTMPPERAQ
jgi:hypothetical protein